MRATNANFEELKAAFLAAYKAKEGHEFTGTFRMTTEGKVKIGSLEYSFDDFVRMASQYLTF